jgi:tyrosyl-tRNA synthetase
VDLLRDEGLFRHDGPVSSTILDDLEWRGLISQTTDRTELAKAMDAGPVTFYLGIDPTAPSIHVGNLVVLLVMKRLQLAGHNPLPLVGGATGLVGDPSGRSEERSLNEEETVQGWVQRITAQLSRYLNFEGPHAARVVNNLDWTKDISALTLLREIGKHFSVNQMLSKDSVSARLEGGGISYTEFSYQILQALDFLELFKRHHCTLQIGGSDQWGNITAGLDLIRKTTGKTAHALTVPLMTKSDGSKFGKTAAGTVWLDPTLTSPYDFYQFWVNSDDADIPKYLKVFSFKSQGEIQELIAAHQADPGSRTAHKALAEELTSMVHGEGLYREVEFATRAFFGHAPIIELSEATLESSLTQLPTISITQTEPIPSLVDLLAGAGLVESKSAARRIIREGGAYVNNEKVVDEGFIPSREAFLYGRFLVLRKGKKDLGAAILH